jgi:hypothetical protein
MRITVLSVPDCPNVAVLLERLKAAGARGDGAVDVVLVRNEEDAARWGMAGSPTLLLDGADPFADAAAAPVLGCRLYRDSDGVVSDAPSVEQLREVLAAVSGPSEPRR